jgi:hypothetical protein
LKNAIARIHGCPSQRCCVHFIPRHAQALPALPAWVRLGRAARGVQRRGPRAVTRARHPTSGATRAGSRTGRAPRGDRAEVARVSRTPRRTCSTSTSSHRRTGPSCDRPTRWNASTPRSAAAPTSLGSSRTIPRRDSPRRALLSDQTKARRPPVPVGQVASARPRRRGQARGSQGGDRAASRLSSTPTDELALHHYDRLDSASIINQAQQPTRNWEHFKLSRRASANPSWERPGSLCLGRLA